LDKNELTTKYIVNIQGHQDRTRENGILKRQCNTPILIQENDAHMIGKLGKISLESFSIRSYSSAADVLLEESDFIRFGNTALEVLHNQPQQGQHITSGRKRSLDWRRIVCRLNWQNGFFRQFGAGLESLIRQVGQFAK
jgi:hypothetical protein